METVSIIGAGSWGTALAFVLAENGHDSLIWTRRAEQADEINDRHTNHRYLPEVKLPENLNSTSDLKTAVQHAKTIVLAVPTVAMRETCRSIQELLTEPAVFVHVSKGIDPDSLKRISEIIAEEIDESLREAIVVLSGPSHAEEVVMRHPTTVAAASCNMAAAERVQDLFMSNYFRVYTNKDVIGVELGGALKNVIALAAGISDGLGYGDNAKAALITRGLAEITRLGVKMGAGQQTFSGLTGLGDLVVTCTSVHSRNWRAGNLLGKGQSLEKVTEEMGMVIEGVRTTKAAYRLAQQFEVNMPLTEALYSILFGGIPPKQAVDQLMSRGKKQEIDTFFGI
ncbi:glycerol-3-phosphate dehydrogenase [Sporosarcina sp. P37]|uniref:NAD(P)H-dependent glycerol-3-phosphate dehydrogenase n=1 Tax=unclassified Sporosarcina TaxID=2647733 RepID=UPI0009C01F3B|nr:MULTISPECIES: NAD(P)H-dependent glycerol-3-phosphate dehydrogenase [unclassified Sporosarcina]ARD49441.1 glycerol-3-phosphate dehydrogenase [Sporosarcina sp. P33]ARK25917.1 glycerol-3-phosphate dehydrogenase [Sporosarcina sp. P37]PID18262.1 NAD(P)H-dependent glycerol-3-phosphate dehydrogenase [Sporosarcina sp. P35]